MMLFCVELKGKFYGIKDNILYSVTAGQDFPGQKHFTGW